MALVLSCTPKLVEDYMQPVEMLFSCPQEYNYIV